MFFTVVIMGVYSQEAYIAKKAETDLIAEDAAKAGIQDALYYLKKDSSWKTGFNNVKLPHSGATYSMTFDSNQKTLPWSFNNYDNKNPATGWEGRTVPSYSVYLVSTGKFSNSEKVIKTIVTFGQSSFQDDFSDPNQSRRNWQNIGEVSGQGSHYEFNSTGTPPYFQLGDFQGGGKNHASFAGQTYWKDYTMELKAQLVNSQGSNGTSYGIFFRSGDVTSLNDINSYLFSFKYVPKTRAVTIAFYTVNDGKYNEKTPLSTTTFTRDDSYGYGIHNIKIDIKSNNFTASIDGEEILRGTELSNLYPSGKIGLFKDGGNDIVKFSGFSVSGQGGGGLVIDSLFH